MQIQNFEDLEVWKKAIALADHIYILTETFPKQEMFGLSSQLRRAAVSIASNIAEGSARGSRNEFAQFISISRGSLAELQTQLIIANNRGFIKKSVFEATLHEVIIISKMLMGLLRSLRESYKAPSTKHKALTA